MGSQGITFSKVFTISDSQYADLKYATLNLDFIPDYGPFYEDPPILFINDIFLGSILPFFPPIGVGCWNYWSNGTHDYCGFMRVSTNISRTILSSGENTFRIDNGAPDDDYRFTNVTVVLFYTSMLSPNEENLWIADEQDTIRWEGIADDLLLTIDYSTDSGTNWEEIASGVSSNDEKYCWDIPEEILSTKCLILLRDSTTNDILAMSDMFKIKPYIITKIDAVTGDFITYDIDKDRWGFGNFQNDMWPYSYWFNNFDYNGIDPFTNKTYRGGVFTGAFRFDFPDWISWVNTFGVSSCYWSISLGIYSPTAVVTWGINKRVWGGSCAGIANSNALVFNNMDNFRNKYPDFPNFNNPIDVTSNSSVIKTITELFTHQYGNQIEKHIADNWNSKTPNQTLNELKEVLKKGNTDIRTISFWHNTKSMGHCILPYAIEQDDVSKNIWYIYVYDNSYPNNQTALILIDTSANGGNGSWLTQYAWQDWGGNGKLILDLPATTYLESAEFKNRFNSGSTFLLGDTELQVYPTQYSDVEILDSQGNKTGYSGGNVNSEIPGSVPLIIPTSTLSPPYCYSLSVGNYSIKLNNFSEDTIACNLMKGNRLFSYQRYDAGNNQIDKLYFDGGLSLSNSDQTIKQINLKSILADTTNEKIFSIRSLDLSENDSARIEAVDGNKLKLTSYASSSKEYEIGLEYASETVSQLFSNSLVQLSGNSTHTIVPDWSNIYENQLEILIDLGNDGTIDDTLYLDNEVTGIGNDQGSLIPTEYRLEQNYPNPFNPSTIISYQLPKAGNVTLKVYDVLGNEIATLVDEYRNAGSYDVQFTMNNVQLSSGIYFYQLKAGEFVETMKMILLK